MFSKENKTTELIHAHEFFTFSFIQTKQSNKSPEGKITRKKKNDGLKFSQIYFLSILSKPSNKSAETTISQQETHKKRPNNHE